jgi:hypothetical protein
MSDFILNIARKLTPVWRDGELYFHTTARSLGTNQIRFAKANRHRLCGLFLLALLRRLSLRPEVVRSSHRPSGWVIIPTGYVENIAPRVFALYDNYHDDAIDEILNVCKKLKISPSAFQLERHWPEIDELKDKAAYMLS